MARVVVASSAAEMAAIRPAWHALERTGKYTIFQSFEWNQLAARIFASRAVPRVVFAETEGGMAIVPAAISGQNITLLGEELFDYRDVLAMGDGRALSLAWGKLGEIAKQHGLDFKVKGVMGSSFGLGSTGGVKFKKEFFANAPSVRPHKGGNTIHPRLGRNLQRMIGQGCTLELFHEHETPLLRSIYQLKAGQDSASLFHDALRVEMACAMARSSGAACETFVLLDGAVMVAALITFVDQKTRRLYTIYCNRRWARYSPGTSLMEQVIQSSLRSGMAVDLMTGEQPYKQRFANSSEPLYTLHATPAMLLGDAVQPDQRFGSQQPSLVA